MRQKRWLAAWRAETNRPVFYHCISRVVERRFALEATDKEKFRTCMRMLEKFSGCRVVAYCIMGNHFHLLLEVPPMPEGGLSDAGLLQRLGALYSAAFVGEVAAELAAARADSARNSEARVAEIHARFTYRMHDLGEFMKGLLQRFTQWFNRVHSRKGHLWEDRFKSVIVEDGYAAITMAAYIDLNPVRAGMVDDPAKYRWSSYGEAIGGGAKGNGLTARGGLVRALRGHLGVAADAALWSQGVSRQYRRMLMTGAVKVESSNFDRDGREVRRAVRKGITREAAAAGMADDGDIPYASALRCRIRYFTDGAVIGSRAFVNEAFAQARERFGPKRKDGARKLRGAASAMNGRLWTMRDLRQA